jgi:cytochrome P450
VDELFESNSNPDSTALRKLKYLQAVIDEALRLYPPVPSGLQRLTPAEGVTIGDIFVPGDTIVYLPSYTMYRGEF